MSFRGVKWQKPDKCQYDLLINYVKKTIKDLQLVSKIESKIFWIEKWNLIKSKTTVDMLKNI